MARGITNVPDGKYIRNAGENPEIRLNHPKIQSVSISEKLYIKLSKTEWPTIYSDVFLVYFLRIIKILWIVLLN